MKALLALPLITGLAFAQDTVRVKAGAPAWGTNVGLKQLYVLGGPPEYQIGRVYSTAVDKQNRVYVFDGVSSQIRAYGADGKFLRNIGRAGAGPGEYRMVLGATIVDDSILSAYDVGGLRLVNFFPDGTPADMVQLKRPLTTMSGQLRSDTGDRLLLQASFIVAADGRSSQSLPPGQQQIIRVARDGRFVDSMPVPHYAPIAEPSFNTFAPRSYSMFSSAGAVVFGTSDSYRFTIASFDAPPRVVEKSWTPVPLTGEERDQIVARYDEQVRQDPRHPPYNLSRTKPAFREIFTDQDGRIWVNIFTAATRRPLPRDTSKNALPPLDWRQDPTFDVFDPTGKLLGTVVLASGSMLWAARNDRVYVRSTGPEGEERLIAYQLTIRR
jgi:hypothetical protein